MRLNIARAVERSAANGPGERYVIWVQGCALACDGCWNRDTWSFARRDVRDVRELAATICGTPGIEGVTFSGGEPFAQARALAHIGRAVREAGLSVFVFTGYAREELTSPRHRELLASTDVLVSGRYEQAQRSVDLTWRGSTNQRVTFLTDRYGPEAMRDPVHAEVTIGANGAVSLTGFPADGLRAL